VESKFIILLIKYHPRAVVVGTVFIQSGHHIYSVGRALLVPRDTYTDC